MSDPRLWDLYQAGLVEFFQNMPYVDGLMIRTGEAGNVYNMPGWDYYSTLAVTTVESVRAMLTKFTQTAAAYDKTIYFRTWSVGVGEVGDMHTDPRSYAAVLDGIPAHNLVVVTKFTMGDFYSWIPLNPTLEQGSQPRTVEFQSRREFEGFSSSPNYLSADHQQALQHLEAKNPNIQGVWVWTQDGGPWRAGPMSLYLKTGFWQLYDLDVYATGRLAWEADADLRQVNRDWIEQNLSDERSSYDCGRWRSLGRVLVCVAVPLLALGALMQWSGLEAALTTFNDQMALLPLGLSRILGITVHLDIPPEIPLYLLVLGMVLGLAGLLMGAGRRTTAA